MPFRAPTLYLHGLSSSANSAKGAHLGRVFSDRGQPLARPDLNLPSFERLDVDAMLCAITDLADALAPEGAPVRLIGSSLGGWLATRWASLHPGRVERMLLLCPAFHMEEHWPRILGPERVSRWQAAGSLALPDHAGVARPVHWAFVASHARHPTAPEPHCLTLILHGSEDAIVPLESSRRYAARHPGLVTLRELADDHALMVSLSAIEEAVVSFLGLGEA